MKTKPFLKWAGGKYRVLEHVLPALPEGSRLIEPFTGAGSVFLNAPFESFLLAEANQDLIALYKQLQKNGARFIRYAERLFDSKHNHPEAYYKHRQAFNQATLGTQKRAALFLYLNRHGYNGLCRYNLSGHYNVPFGRYVKPYFPQAELEAFHQKSKKAEFLTADFSKTFTKAKPGDVIYCDPPYAPLSKTSYFTSYIAKKFGEQEQIKLAELALQTSKQGTPVIISNHDTPFTRELYKAARCNSFPVQRNISCKGSKRVSVSELIAVFR